VRGACSLELHFNIFIHSLKVTFDLACSWVLNLLLVRIDVIMYMGINVIDFDTSMVLEICFWVFFRGYLSFEIRRKLGLWCQALQIWDGNSENLEGREQSSGCGS